MAYARYGKGESSYYFYYGLNGLNQFWVSVCHLFIIILKGLGRAWRTGFCFLFAHLASML
jgi:hypothetical protein